RVPARLERAASRLRHFAGRSDSITSNPSGRSLMHPTIATIAVLASVTNLVAQTTIVPSAAATTDPKYYSSVYFYSTTTTNESRTLTLYSSADIAQPVLTFNSMEVR